MNERVGKLLTIFVVGGLCYGFMEILNRGFSHITMGILGGCSFIVIHILNGERRSGKMGLLSILFISGFFITSIEFLAGEYLNRVLMLNIWSYRDMPLNFDGQICLPFALLWVLLSFVGVIADDFIRFRIFGEERNYEYFERKNKSAAA